MYQIYATDTFKKIYDSLNKDEKIWIDKFKEKLKESISGKILKYAWFREKKCHDKRLYFIVDEQSKKILFVSFATKKKQQEIINFITLNMQELLDYIKKI